MNALEAIHPLDTIIVVLNRPQEVVNIGAVVRAMKNMGISHLRLVRPEPFTGDEILRVAHRCDDIIDRMTIHDQLDDALADTNYVIGTAAIAHHKRPQTNDIRGLAQDIHRRAHHYRPYRVALLFGQEDDGLDNHALDRCHLVAMLPSNPAYPALNLAQSVLLFLYEIRMAAGSALSSSEPSPDPLATQAELEQLFNLSEEALTTLDFFRYSPEVVIRTLRQMTYRMGLRSAEAKLLLAILRKLITTQQGK